MKVLYIGHYRDGTGYGQAAQDYILALDSVGVDVVARPFRLNNSTAQIPKRLQELESKSSVGATHCIQHTLPIHMDFNGRFKKNIALFASETEGMENTSWVPKLKAMDHIWVINKQMDDEWSKNLQHKNPIMVIPHAVDINKFRGQYEQVDIPPAVGHFKFYFVSELSRRKNLVALLRAFHSEFAWNEPVSLVIKTHISGVNPQETQQKVSDLCRLVKQDLKLLPVERYKKEVVITDNLSEHDLMRLHATCDCLVVPSFGEAWSLPAMDALGMGNPVIVPDIPGQFEFVGDSLNGFRVEAHRDYCLGQTGTFPDLYTGEETWWSVSVEGLMSAMRCAFELGNGEMNDYARATPEKFSYEKVGAMMKEVLEF